MTPAGDAHIAVTGLVKVYGRGDAAVHALRGVDMTVGRGEWVSIVGPSGSGKTTLLNILGALDAHYEGSVCIAGRELRGLRDRDLSRFRGQTIGFVFQHFNLLPHLSVLENVMVPGFFVGRTQASDERASELLERVGLTEKRKARPTELSGGQQQRVAIARALFNHTEILLCDEPTGALDRQTGEQVLDLFASLSEREGLTLIVVTHEPSVSQMADRIIELMDGKVVRSSAGGRSQRGGEPPEKPAKATDATGEAAGEANGDAPA